jgi:RecJ-like exonuclease
MENTEAQQVQHETCAACSGTGWAAYSPCPVCYGQKHSTRILSSETAVGWGDEWDRDRAELLERCRKLQEQVASLQARLAEADR